MRFIDKLLQGELGPAERYELTHAVTIVSDNVSRYYWQESDQEHWEFSDFPNVAPPFPSFWLDYRKPEYINSREYGITPWIEQAPDAWGFLGYGFDLKKEEGRNHFLTGAKQYAPIMQEAMTRARWGMSLLFFYGYDHSPALAEPTWYWHFLIDENGNPVGDGEKPMIINAPGNDRVLKELQRLIGVKGSEEEAHQHIYNAFAPYFECALLTLSFLHCKNVALNEVNPPVKTVHNKSQKRRGIKPFQPVMYKMLDIRPMREVLHKEGQSEKVGIKQAMHICRGHFRHYEEGRGLFGKYHGTYWVPMHVRGTAEQGKILKDYTVKLPD